MVFFYAARMHSGIIRLAAARCGAPVRPTALVNGQAARIHRFFLLQDTCRGRICLAGRRNSSCATQILRVRYSDFGSPKLRFFDGLGPLWCAFGGALKGILEGSSGSQSHIERRREKEEEREKEETKKEHEKEEGAESDRTRKREFQRGSKKSPNFLTRPVRFRPRRKVGADVG